MEGSKKVVDEIVTQNKSLVIPARLPTDPGHLLQRVELCRDTLWLKYFNRVLYSFNLSDRVFVRESPPFISGTDDFILFPDGKVLVVMEKGDTWINTGGDWEFLTDIPFAGLDPSRTRTSPPRINRPGFGAIPEREHVYRVFIHDDEIIALTPFNVYRFSLDRGEWRSAALSDWIFDAVQISVGALKPDNILVGFNRGEVPGGLKMVSLESGTVTTIDGRQPVTGLVPDDKVPGTIVASAGCSHRSLDFGGIYQVTPSAFVPLRMGSAVFDLKTVQNGIIGAGPGVVLHYNNGKITTRDPGTFVETNGLKMATTPDGIIVMTDINTLVSSSGLTPLFAPDIANKGFRHS